MKEVYTLDDLQGWKEATAQEKLPIRLGVLGDPVAHSLSPPLQNAALAATNAALRYARFQIAPNELATALDLMRALDFVGVNLTVPHKLAALALVDEVEERAQKI